MTLRLQLSEILSCVGVMNQNISNNMFHTSSNFINGPLPLFSLLDEFSKVNFGRPCQDNLCCLLKTKFPCSFCKCRLKYLCNVIMVFCGQCTTFVGLKINKCTQSFREAYKKNRIFYDIESNSFPTYPTYLIMTL